MRTEGGHSGRVLQDLHYTFDPAGNITHIRDDAHQEVFFANARVEARTRYRYDALFRLTEATGREHLGQAGAHPHSHNDAPRVGRVGIPHASDGEALGRYLERYLYDAVGNIASVQHIGTNPHNPGWTRNYAYAEPSQLEPDKVSNRLTSTTVGRISAPAVHKYDEHGNMLDMPHLAAMRWNELDQLQMTQRQVVNDTDGTGRHGERTWYVYDGGGQRIRKVTERPDGRIKDERLYLGSFETYREHRSQGEDLVRETLHIMDDTQRIALVETRISGEEKGIPRRQVRYQLANHLGSATLEVDDQARILSYEEYSPYGGTTYQAVRSQLQTPKRYRFTAMERDDESGLNYHSARYYAPWLGRWTSADPVGLIDGTNLYRYARNNPTWFSDRKGTDPDPLTFQERAIDFELNYDARTGGASYKLTIELQSPDTGDRVYFSSQGDVSGLQDLLISPEVSNILTAGEQENLYSGFENFTELIGLGGASPTTLEPQDSEEPPIGEQPLRIVGNTAKGIAADRALPQRYRLEPARGATVTGIRDTHSGPTRGKPPRPVGRPVIRVDRPHGRTKYPHINIETLRPDPHHPISPRTLRGLERTARGLEKVGRVARPVAIVTDVARLGIAVHEDKGLGKNTARTAASVAGGWAGAAAGAWAGAKAGAALGGALGTVVPGLGNAAGAAIGGLIGGIVGGIAGGFLGSWAGESAADTALE